MQLSKIKGPAQLAKFESSDITTRVGKQLVTLLESNGIYKFCNTIIDSLIDPFIVKLLKMCDGLKLSEQSDMDFCERDYAVKDVFVSSIRMVFYISLSYVARYIFGIDTFLSSEVRVVQVGS